MGPLQVYSARKTPDTLNRRNHTGHRIGEWHHRAKLTTAQVQAIREDYAAGRGGYQALAKRYGCGTSTVRDIVQGATRWAG